MNRIPWEPGMRTLEAIYKITCDSSQEVPNFMRSRSSSSRSLGSQHTSINKLAVNVKRASNSLVHRTGHA